MRWIVLMAVVLLSTGCVYSNTEVVEYRQVSVAPVVEPVILDTYTPDQLDVTTTTIDFY